MASSTDLENGNEIHFVMLYGPPAVGKLTIAREVVARTGYRLFDNHASVNAALPVFGFGTPPYERVVDALRTHVFEEAADANIDVVFTFVYAKGVDDDAVGRWLRIFHSSGNDAFAVRLFADLETLEDRVGDESRRRRGKLFDHRRLHEVLDRYDLHAAIPHMPSLEIDTRAIDPTVAASRIIDHFHLPNLAPGG